MRQFQGIPIPCVTENKSYFEVYTYQVLSHCHGFASFEHLKLQVSNKHKIILHWQLYLQIRI